MIMVENTELNAGVEVSGDYHDFEALYEAIHNIVGEEGEYPPYEGARLHVLAVCYDLRHAMMGDRSFKRVENGFDREKMRYLSMIASEENIYLTIHVLWPELLFVTMALNDFIKEYAGKNARHTSNSLEHTKNIWSEDIAIIRMFQSQIAKAIGTMVSPSSYTRMMNMLNKNDYGTMNYTTQYLTVLNSKFINMDADERMRNLTIMAKRLTEAGKEYEEVKKEVREAAKNYQCSPQDIRLNMHFPEEIDW
ncbi:MAG: hypothetical protein WAM07_00490 [Halobacillus sp.]|uniref:DUF6904 family protein n=1 Tax=Halobacillus sp. TaxID=56800 RepID=UPI003BB0C497